MSMNLSIYANILYSSYLFVYSLLILFICVLIYYEFLVFFGIFLIYSYFVYLLINNIHPAYGTKEYPMW